MGKTVRQPLSTDKPRTQKAWFLGVDLLSLSASLFSSAGPLEITVLIYWKKKNKQTTDFSLAEKWRKENILYLTGKEVPYFSN